MQTITTRPINGTLCFVLLRLDDQSGWFNTLSSKQNDSAVWEPPIQINFQSLFHSKFSEICSWEHWLRLVGAEKASTIIWSNNGLLYWRINVSYCLDDLAIMLGFATQHWGYQCDCPSANWIIATDLGESIHNLTTTKHNKARIVCTPWWMHNICISECWTRLPWTKWPPFRRRYFQIHFREWKCLNFD